MSMVLNAVDFDRVGMLCWLTRRELGNDSPIVHQSRGLPRSEKTTIETSNFDVYGPSSNAMIQSEYPAIVEARISVNHPRFSENASSMRFQCCIIICFFLPRSHYLENFTLPTSHQTSPSRPWPYKSGGKSPCAPQKS